MKNLPDKVGDMLLVAQREDNDVLEKVAGEAGNDLFEAALGTRSSIEVLNNYKSAVIEAFIKTGKNPNDKFENGKTPLQVAREAKDNEVMKALLKNGAIPDKETVLYARKSNDESLINTLSISMSTLQETRINVGGRSNAQSANKASSTEKRIAKSGVISRLSGMLRLGKRAEADRVKGVDDVKKQAQDNSQSSKKFREEFEEQTQKRGKEAHALMKGMLTSSKNGQDAFMEKFVNLYRTEPTKENLLGNFTMPKDDGIKDFANKAADKLLSDAGLKGDKKGFSKEQESAFREQVHAACKKMNEEMNGKIEEYQKSYGTESIVSYIVQMNDSVGEGGAYKGTSMGKARAEVRNGKAPALEKDSAADLLYKACETAVMAKHSKGIRAQSWVASIKQKIGKEAQVQR